MTPAENLIVSRTKLARILGCKPDHVSRLISEGLPTVQTGGGRGRQTQINLGAAVRWAIGRDHAAADRSRAKKLGAQARMAELEAKRREGLVIDLADVEREAFESSRIIREGMLNLASRLASELAAESDAQKVFIRLDTEIRAALHSAADALEQRASDEEPNT